MLCFPFSQRAREAAFRGKWKDMLVVLTTFAAAMIIGDGAFTPAISIMSAIEGLAVYVPAFQPQPDGRNPAVLLIVVVVILLILFALQRFGTRRNPTKSVCRFAHSILEQVLRKWETFWVH